MYASKSLDMYIFEHAAKPEFWLLGALAVGFFAANLVACARYRCRQEGRRLDVKKEHASSSDKGQEVLPSGVRITEKSSKSALPRLEAQPKFTAWTAEYLTTRLRVSLAVAIYIAVLGAQLLEGYWVMVTLARWTVKVYSRWPQSPGTLAYWVYFLSSGVMLLANITAVVVGGIIVMFQLLWISELYLQQLAVN